MIMHDYLVYRASQEDMTRVMNYYDNDGWEPIIVTTGAVSDNGAPAFLVVNRRPRTEPRSEGEVNVLSDASMYMIVNNIQF